jgi:hypothetical protein
MIIKKICETLKATSCNKFTLIQVLAIILQI